MQHNNSHSSCGQKRMNSTSLKQKFADVMIVPSDNDVANCSCDTKCELDISCSCGEPQTFKLNSEPRNQHSSCQNALNGGGSVVNVFPECHQCSKTLYKYRNLIIGSDAGYFSSSGATSKCSSCDCLNSNNESCHNSEINCNESMLFF